MKKTTKKNQLPSIDELVTHFVANQPLFNGVKTSIDSQLRESQKLKDLSFLIKSRIKDPSHLKDKLERKAKEAQDEGKAFHITKENIFSEINDLVGFRIIHLHTKQVEQIDIELKRLFNENKWPIIEGPSARTWDDEMRSYFRRIGIDIHDPPDPKTMMLDGKEYDPNMYTSVHYVIKTNSLTGITSEIQVRTLMEEVWGEVDHTINYPHKTKSASCRSQIKVLARATSTCGRLIDSIFSTHDEFSSALKIAAKPVSSKKQR